MCLCWINNSFHKKATVILWLNSQEVLKECECLLCFSQKISSYQGGQGQNYSSYNQSQSSYYGSNNSVAQGGYYSQWGGYDQYSGYNSSYNNTYNTGYNTGYNSGYNYNYGYGYPPPGHMPPPPIGMPPTSTDMSGAVEVRTRTPAEFNICAGSS